MKREERTATGRLKDDVATDGDDVLDDMPVLEPARGGSDVLRKALKQAAVHSALNAKDGLEIRVIPAIVHLFEQCRRSAMIVILLADHRNDVEAAAKFALTQNGIPGTMLTMATKMVRDGGGMTVDYGPYVEAVCVAVAQHYKLAVGGHDQDTEPQNEAERHLQAS